MQTKVIYTRVTETTHRQLFEIAKIVNVDTSKIVQYLVDRGLEEFERKGTAAFDVNFWTNPRAWIRHKNSLREVKAFEMTPEGRDAALKHGIEVDSVLSELDKEEKE